MKIFVTRQIPGDYLKKLSEAGHERTVTNKKIVDQLDKFLLNLIEDIKEYIGVESLSIICFDVGVINTGRLDKKSIVPLECQMPFSALAYFMKYKHGMARFLDFYYSALA